MNEQPEALRLINNRQNAHLLSWQANACSELRRLHAANQELLEALKMGYNDTMDYIRLNHLTGAENNHWLVLARDAIAKHGEQQ